METLAQRSLIHNTLGTVNIYNKSYQIWVAVPRWEVSVSLCCPSSGDGIYSIYLLFILENLYCIAIDLTYQTAHSNNKAT